MCAEATHDVVLKRLDEQHSCICIIAAVGKMYVGFVVRGKAA